MKAVILLMGEWVHYIFKVSMYVGIILLLSLIKGYTVS